MIIVDFSVAIALFCVVLMAGFGFFGLFRKKEKAKQMHLDPRFMWFCSICTYTYINTKEEVITLCPRCGSYNKKGA